MMMLYTPITQIYNTWTDVTHPYLRFFRIISLGLSADIMVHNSPQNTLLQGKWMMVDCVCISTIEAGLLLS